MIFHVNSRREIDYEAGSPVLKSNCEQYLPSLTYVAPAAKKFPRKNRVPFQAPPQGDCSWMVRELELGWVAGLWSGWEKEGRERKFFVSRGCDLAFPKITCLF
jgi:hypothetical protein